MNPATEAIAVDRKWWSGRRHLDLAIRHHGDAIAGVIASI
jgi:hypothetical protein